MNDASTKLPNINISPFQRRYIESELTRLVGSLDGLQAAVLSTVDGFEIASRCPNASFNGGNLAALASSLTAISRAVLREVSFDDCERLLIESHTGRIVFQPIQSVIPCSICVAVASSALLGRTFWSIDEFVKSLRTLPTQPEGETSNAHQPASTFSMLLA